MSDAAKDKYIELARKNGQLARVKSGRVSILMKFYSENPSNRKWVRDKAVFLCRSVAFHLRLAYTISKRIDELERKWSLHNGNKKNN